MTILSFKPKSRPLFPTLLLSLAILLSACSDSSNNNSNQNNQSSTLGVPGANNDNVVAVPAAAVEGPLEGPPILVSTFIDLPSLGYTPETEYLLSGTAKAYVNVNELGSDGKWQVEASTQADYKTRAIVIRPADPAGRASWIRPGP